MFNIPVYAEFMEAENVEYYDGSRYWRKQVRSGSLMLDHTITELGFAGIENTDWVNAKEMTIP
jgi:hypothetical protein